MKTIPLFPQKLTVVTSFLRRSVNKAYTAIRLLTLITLLKALVCFAIKKENNLVSPFLNFLIYNRCLKNPVTCSISIEYVLGNLDTLYCKGCISLIMTFDTFDDMYFELEDEYIRVKNDLIKSR